MDRAALTLALLLSAVSPTSADDLDDLPDLACALASTPLERQHIGCPVVAEVEVLRWSGEAIQAARPDDAVGDARTAPRLPPSRAAFGGLSLALMAIIGSTLARYRRRGRRGGAPRHCASPIRIV